MAAQGQLQPVQTALRCYQTALEHAPANPDLLKDYSRTLRVWDFVTGTTEGSERIVEMVRDAFKNYPHLETIEDFWIAISYACQNMGRLEEAYAAAKQALVVCTDDSSIAWFILGRCESKMHSFGSATESLQRSVTLSSRQGSNQHSRITPAQTVLHAHSELAAVSAELGNNRIACSELRQMLGELVIDPADVESVRDAVDMQKQAVRILRSMQRVGDAKHLRLCCEELRVLDVPCVRTEQLLFILLITANSLMQAPDEDCTRAVCVLLRAKRLYLEKLAADFLPDLLLGTCYGNLGMYAQAVECFSRAADNIHRDMLSTVIVPCRRVYDALKKTESHVAVHHQNENENERDFALFFQTHQPPAQNVPVVRPKKGRPKKRVRPIEEEYAGFVRLDELLCLTSAERVARYGHNAAQSPSSDSSHSPSDAFLPSSKRRRGRPSNTELSGPSHFDDHSVSPVHSSESSHPTVAVLPPSQPAPDHFRAQLTTPVASLSSMTSLQSLSYPPMHTLPPMHPATAQPPPYYNPVFYAPPQYPYYASQPPPPPPPGFHPPTIPPADPAGIPPALPPGQPHPAVFQYPPGHPQYYG